MPTEKGFKYLVGELPEGCPVCGQDLDSNGRCPNGACEYNDILDNREEE
jgi:hypothetical protein